MRRRALTGSLARRGVVVALAMLALVLAASGTQARRRERPVSTTPTVEAGSVPFRRAAGRILVTLAFARPDGRTRPVLAWLNMGTPTMAITPALARDLGAGDGRPLAFRLGDLAVTVGPERVEVGAPKLDGEDVLAHLFAPLPVEAILPASVLARYELVLDIMAGRMILAPPGSITPEGVAVPIRVDADTGVAAVDAEIDGERHLLALDAGASFTWLRGGLARRWLAAHPDWLRAEGAVGRSNMGLTGLDIERRGTLLRLPAMTLGGRLSLTDLGAFGTAPLLCDLCDRLVGDLFWDGWQRNAPGPVAGWLGAEALDGMRLTIDYPGRVSYWQRRRPAAPPTIAQVGVTLQRHDGVYAIGGIVVRDGRPTVDGIEIGDRLLGVDGRDMAGLPSDAVMEALAGAPGALHRLTLGRSGRIVEVNAPVIAF